jgi:hypothetical protein
MLAAVLVAPLFAGDGFVASINRDGYVANSKANTLLVMDGDTGQFDTFLENGTRVYVLTKNRIRNIDADWYMLFVIGGPRNGHAYLASVDGIKLQ